MLRTMQSTLRGNHHSLGAWLQTSRFLRFWIHFTRRTWQQWSKL